MRQTVPALLLGVFVALISTSVACAADLPRPVYKAPAVAPAPMPPFSWNGIYIGIHGGYGWSTFDSGGTSDDAKGWLGGFQLGYNYQIDSFVLGVEGDFSFADVADDISDPFGTGGNASLKNDYFATIAGRVGYAFDRFLVYGKGGVAFTRDKYDITDGIGGFANGTFNRTGWMVGGGLEYAFWDNWSVKAEYNYLSFGSITETLTAGGGITASPANVSLISHLVKVGLNYRFNLGSF